VPRHNQPLGVVVRLLLDLAYDFLQVRLIEIA
jgi:hypothetical protein